VARLTSRLAVGVLALLLLACAAPRPAATPTLAPSATPTLAPSATPLPRATPTLAPSATPAPRRQFTIWAVVPESRQAAFGGWMRDAAHLADIELSIVMRSADGLATDVAAARLTSIALPDAFYGDQDDLALLLAAGVIDRSADSIDDARLLPAAREATGRDGVRWGTPLAAHGALVLLTNRALSDAAPTTVADLIAAAAPFRDRDQAGLVAGWAEARWFTALLAATGGAALDDPAALGRALDLLAALRAVGPATPMTYVQGLELFRAGGAPFAFDGDWALDALRTADPPLDLAYAPLPADDAGRPLVGVLTIQALMLRAGLPPDDRTTLGRFATLLLSEPLQRRIAGDFGMLPALAGLATPDALPDDAALRAAARTAALAPGIPPDGAVRCRWELVEQALPAFLLEQVSRDDTITRVIADARRCANAG